MAAHGRYEKIFMLHPLAADHCTAAVQAEISLAHYEWPLQYFRYPREGLLPFSSTVSKGHFPAVGDENVIRQEWRRTVVWGRRLVEREAI